MKHRTCEKNRSCRSSMALHPFVNPFVKTNLLHRFGTSVRSSFLSQNRGTGGVSLLKHTDFSLLTHTFTTKKVLIYLNPPFSGCPGWTTPHYRPFGFQTGHPDWRVLVFYSHSVHMHILLGASHRSLTGCRPVFGHGHGHGRFGRFGGFASQDTRASKMKLSCHLCESFVVVTKQKMYHFCCS